MKRFVATAALAGWVGLAIQQYLILYSRWTSGASLLGGLISFFSFFTVLTNTLVVVVLSYALVKRDSGAKRFFLAPRISSAIAASIVVVSLAYNLLLRHLWSPQGFQFIADELLHDVMPLLFVVYWWRCVPKGPLRLKHIAVLRLCAAAGAYARAVSVPVHGCGQPRLSTGVCECRRDFGRVHRHRVGDHWPGQAPQIPLDLK